MNELMIEKLIRKLEDLGFEFEVHKNFDETLYLWKKGDYENFGIFGENNENSLKSLVAKMNADILAEKVRLGEYIDPKEFELL